MPQIRPADIKEMVTFKYVKGKQDNYPGVFHSFYEVYFLLNGNVEFVCSNLRKKLRPLDVVIIPPGEFHRFILCDNGENYERCVLRISPQLLSEEVLRDAFLNKRILRPDKNDRIIQHLNYLKEVEETCSKEDFKAISHAIATDLVFLIKHAEGLTSFTEKGLRSLSIEIMKYINANYKSELSLQGVAETFFVSVSTACHYFKEDYGVSIKQYIIEKKMNKAETLIDIGYKSQDVCKELGFDNYSTFFRAYKKHFGVSPKGKV